MKLKKLSIGIGILVLVSLFAGVVTADVSACVPGQATCTTCCATETGYTVTDPDQRGSLTFVIDLLTNRKTVLDQVMSAAGSGVTATDKNIILGILQSRIDAFTALRNTIQARIDAHTACTAACSGPVVPACGNGDKEGTEQCDFANERNTNNVQSSTQETYSAFTAPAYGQSATAYYCSDACVSRQTSELGPRCGDGQVQTANDEQCDGTNWNGKTCQTEVGPTATGALSCSNTCTLVTTGCTVPATQRVVNVDPNSGKVKVDGVEVAAADSYIRAEGSGVVLEAFTPFVSSTGTERTFTHWLKGTEQITTNPLTLVVPNTNILVKAIWTIKHPLIYSRTAMPDGGAAFPASVTLPTGVVAGNNLLAESSTAMNFVAPLKPQVTVTSGTTTVSYSTGYSFKGWKVDNGALQQGTADSATAPTTSTLAVTTDAPHTVVAEYECFIPANAADEDPGAGVKKRGAYRGLNADGTLCTTANCVAAQQCVDTNGVRSWEDAVPVS